MRNDRPGEKRVGKGMKKIVPTKKKKKRLEARDSYHSLLNLLTRYYSGLMEFEDGGMGDGGKHRMNCMKRNV